jgi:hypothetical protein
LKEAFDFGESEVDVFNRAHRCNLEAARRIKAVYLKMFLDAFKD